MRTRNILLRIGALLVLFALAGTLVSAGPSGQEPARGLAESVAPAAGSPLNSPFQYSVKFVCGFVPVPGPTAEPPPVKPGDYATAINIHNYTYTNYLLAKRVAVHYREDTPPPVPIPQPRSTWIHKLRVLEIDCIDIWLMLDVQYGTFVKGMVHIGTPLAFPVAAVYTVLQDADGDHVPEFGGQSIDVEYVPPFIHPAVAG